MATSGNEQLNPSLGASVNAEMGAQSSGGPDDRGIVDTLRNSTYRRIDDQKAKASETLGSLAGAVRGMTQPLREGGQSGIADYVNKAANGIERWASDLGQQDINDALRGVQQFARRQPVMFLGIAFSAGLMAARFLKSSQDDQEEYGDSRYPQIPFTDPFATGVAGDDGSLTSSAGSVGAESSIGTDARSESLGTTGASWSSANPRRGLDGRQGSR